MCGAMVQSNNTVKDYKVPSPKSIEKYSLCRFQVDYIDLD